MSTSTNKAVAVHYGQDWDADRDLSYLQEFSLDSLNRGAMLQWISQYPGEAEVLFAPLTGLELYNDHWPTSCATYTGISKSYEAIFLE